MPSEPTIAEGTKAALLSVGMTPERAEAGVSALARSMLASLNEVTDRLVEEIKTENPDYLTDMVSEDDLRLSCRANIERVLQLLGQCVPDGVDPYDAARETGKRRAEQRAALDLVLRSFRLGGRVVWSSALEAARRERDVEQDVLLEIATAVWTVVDTTSSAVSDSYRRTELEMLRADEQRRRVLVDELLRGAGEDPAFADEALRALGLPTTGPYVVVAAASEQVLDAQRAEELLARKGIRSAWRAESATLVGIVGLTGLAIAEVAGVLGALDARIGLSPSVPECAAIPRARELACVALRLIPAGTTGTVSLDDHLPQALLARSPDLAERLVERNLGPVLALPNGEREPLLDTLRMWLDTDCSAKLTASRLYCHRNTVLNRLARLESLLGRSIHGVADTVSLVLALDALKLRQH